MSKALQTSSWGWAKQIVISKEAKEMDSLEVAYDHGIMDEPGLDTTSVALEVFTLVALLNPEFVRKGSGAVR